MLFSIVMISAQVPCKSTVKEALRRSFGLGPYPSSWRGVQDLLQFCMAIGNFSESYFEMTNPSMTLCFPAFQNTL